MFRIILSLFLLLSVPAFSQNRIRLTVPTVSQLSTRPPFTNEVVEVLGYSSLGDWGIPKIFRWDATNTLATNAIRLKSALAVGRYIHEWDGDVRAFGVTSEFPALATETATNQMDSRAMIQSAIDLMSERGGGIVRLPPGRVRIGGSLYMKPRVLLQGTVAPMGFTSPRSLASGQTSRLLAGTTLEMASANGIGEACLIFDGPRYFTNMFTQQFVNFDGDTVY